MRDEAADERDEADVSGPELIEKNMTGPKVRNMANCPSTVAGARTTLVETPKGVELTVTSTDREGEKEIRARAHHLAFVKPLPGVLQHSGRGTGGGKLGYCPVVLVGTEVIVEDIKGGARIDVTARTRSEAATLQQVTRARVEALTKGHL